MVTKKQRNTAIVVMVLIAVGIIFFYNGGLPIAVGTTFTPVYCNDYSFTCCVDDLGASISSRTVTDEIPWMCSGGTRCEIGSYDYSSFISDMYVGSQNCRIVGNFITGHYYKCDDEQATTRKTIYPNERIWTRNSVSPGENREATINDIKIYVDQLVFCGRAGCTQGVGVLGADGCTFNPTSTYNDNGELVNFDTSATSYVVPKGATGCLLTFHPGDRHICGDVEEQCSIDTDCGGHTYGRFECIGRSLQEYGCRSFSKPWYLEEYSDGYAYEPFSVDETGDEQTLSRCEIINARSVQCCGDNDCGSNAFCDVGDTWTCQQTAQCTQDSDCGVSEQCDFSILQLKKPDCVSGQCTFEKVQDVECCVDNNCPIGSFCDDDYECKESAVVKQPCPFECCEDEELYFDRGCPIDRPFCVGTSCRAEDEPDPSDECSDCDAYAKSVIFGPVIKSLKCEQKKILGIPTQTIFTCIFSFLKYFLVPLVFIFTLLFGKDLLSSFKALKGKEPVAWIFAIFISLVLAYLTFTVFTVGIILAIVVIIFRVAIKFIKP